VKEAHHWPSSAVRKPIARIRQPINRGRARIAVVRFMAASHPVRFASIIADAAIVTEFLPAAIDCVVFPATVPISAIIVAIFIVRMPFVAFAACEGSLKAGVLSAKYLDQVIDCGGG
jgi:uncharacterized membrane protein YdbT with pleckstrin-like domain